MSGTRKGCYGKYGAATHRYVPIRPLQNVDFCAFEFLVALAINIIALKKLNVWSLIFYEANMRLPYSKLSSEAYAGLLATKKALDQSSVGKTLIEFIYLRISQINGCSFCLEMHSKSLRSSGVDLEKIDAIAGWRVSDRFDDKEKCALSWCESLVYVNDTHAADEDYEPLKLHFSDVEISDITFAVAVMSAFNRLAIGMRQ